MSIQAVAWVLDHSQSRGVTRLVLISLANHANRESAECWPSVRSIAEEAGVGKSTVARHIDQLVTLGEVEVVEPGTARRSARYRLPQVSQSGTQSPGEERSVQRRAGQNRNEPTSPNGDGLFEAFYEFWLKKPYKPKARLTGSLRGRINRAVKEARSADITAADVHAKGRRYRQLWPEIEATPQALLANWDRFDLPTEAPPCDECDNRGVIWFNPDGERVEWDAFDAVDALKCQGCAS